MPPFEFRIPPTPDAITPELLATTSEDILESMLLNYVLAVRRDAPEVAESLPIGLQAHHIAFLVDGEVLNGGFNQLLFNAPEIAEAAPAAFEHLGMREAASLACRAWQL